MGANRLVLAHERKDAYTLSDATAVAANRVDSRRISLGPRLRYVANDSWSVFVSAHGEYDLSSESQASTTLPGFRWAG